MVITITLYRRSKPENGGHTLVIKVQGFDVTFDNRWVVPHCPLLSKMFDAHINVEYCHSIKLIEYVLKYVYKGNDMAAFGLKQQFQTAVWRIFGFNIHERYPAVVHLAKAMLLIVTE